MKKGIMKGERKEVRRKDKVRKRGRKESRRMEEKERKEEKKEEGYKKEKRVTEESKVEIDIYTIVIPCTSLHTFMKDSACINRVHRNIIKSLQFSLYRNCFAVKIILFAVV